MERLSTPDNTLKLCDHIISVLKNREEYQSKQISSYIKGLKLMCCGLAAERFSLSLLSTEEKIASVLQINNIYLKTHPESYNDIVDVLLNASHLTFEISKMLKGLLSYALKEDLNYRLLIQKLFSHKDFPLVPIDLIEEVVIADSTQLELEIIEMYSENIKTPKENLLWSSARKTHWISWAGQSSKLYWIIISIMNQMLFIAKNKYSLLEIIEYFVDNVKKLCLRDNLDFITLHPDSLHYLVTLMSLESNGLPSQNVKHLTEIVIDQFKWLRKENSFHALILYTHFHKWKTILK